MPELTLALDRTQIKRILILTAVYFCTARVGFLFAPGEQVTLIWPAGGVALASILLYGYRVWPGILLGSFLSKLSVHLPVWMSLSIASGNTIEPLLGAWLLIRYAGAGKYLERTKGIVGLWFLCALTGTLAGTVIGATTVWFSGLQPGSSYGSMFMSWWLADAGGSLVVTPVLLAWGAGPYTMPPARKILEALVLLIVSVFAGIVIFIHPSLMGDVWAYPYFVFPLLIWGALSFGQRCVTLMIAGIANASLSTTLHHIGPFADMPLTQGLVVAETYVMIVMMVGQIVCASISERREAERKIRESWQYLQRIMDHIPDPVLIKNRKHQLIGGNRALWTLLNGPPEKFIGTDCNDAFTRSKEENIFNEKYDRVFDTGKTDVSEELFTDHSGQQHILSIRIALLKEGGDDPSIVAVARDITEIREAETKLQKYARDLEESNRQLDDFSHIASHDLKEPLRGMQSYSQFLLEDYGDRLDAAGRTKLQAISDLAKRLDGTLNALLHYSRLGRTKMAFGDADLNEIVESVIKTFAIKIQETGANVKIAGPLPIVTCDRVRMQEVLQNLIGNALKYTAGKGNIIEIGCETGDPRAPGQNVFYVRDQGIGIPRKHLEEIFKMFKRLHPKEAYGGGSGSGLAIVRKIIDQHRGAVWAESKGEGFGSTFYFMIPSQALPT